MAPLMPQHSGTGLTLVSSRDTSLLSVPHRLLLSSLVFPESTSPPCHMDKAVSGDPNLGQASLGGSGEVAPALVFLTQCVSRPSLPQPAAREARDQQNCNQKVGGMPWLVWLSGLSAGLRTKRVPV